jgi:hypothetical protein
VLVSDRDQYKWRTLVIGDEGEAAIFGLLAQPRSFESLAQYTESSLAGRLDLARLLERWRGLGIIFSDGGQMIHVAADARNQELTRVSPKRILMRSVAVKKFEKGSSSMAAGG